MKMISVVNKKIKNLLKILKSDKFEKKLKNPGAKEWKTAKKTLNKLNSNWKMN